MKWSRLSPGLKLRLLVRSRIFEYNWEMSDVQGVQKDVQGVQKDLYHLLCHVFQRFVYKTTIGISLLYFGKTVVKYAYSKQFV